MKHDPLLDIKDSQEIKKQKKEQTTEEMVTWKWGQGLTKTKDGKENVRN